MKTECACEECVEACTSNPGWFAPGEAERAAEFMRLPFEIFKASYLILDSCSNKLVNKAPYVYSPKKDFEENQSERTSYAYGRCVFLDDSSRCKIHPVKPHECRQAFLCECKFYEHGETPRDHLEEDWLLAGAPLGMRPDCEKYPCDD